MTDTTQVFYRCPMCGRNDNLTIDVQTSAELLPSGEVESLATDTVSSSRDSIVSCWHCDYFAPQYVFELLETIEQSKANYRPEIATNHDQGKEN